MKRVTRRSFRSQEIHYLAFLTNNCLQTESLVWLKINCHLKTRIYFDYCSQNWDDSHYFESNSNTIFKVDFWEKYFQIGIILCCIILILTTLLKLCNIFGKKSHRVSFEHINTWSYFFDPSPWPVYHKCAQAQPRPNDQPNWLQS